MGNYSYGWSFTDMAYNTKDEWTIQFLVVPHYSLFPFIWYDVEKLETNMFKPNANMTGFDPQVKQETLASRVSWKEAQGFVKLLT